MSSSFSNSLIGTVVTLYPKSRSIAAVFGANPDVKSSDLDRQRPRCHGVLAPQESFKAVVLSTKFGYLITVPSSSMVTAVLRCGTFVMGAVTTLESRGVSIAQCILLPIPAGIHRRSSCWVSSELMSFLHEKIGRYAYLYVSSDNYASLLNAYARFYKLMHRAGSFIAIYPLGVSERYTSFASSGEADSGDVDSGELDSKTSSSGSTYLWSLVSSATVAA